VTTTATDLCHNCDKPIIKVPYAGEPAFAARCEDAYGARWAHADGTPCIKTFPGGSADVLVLPKPHCPECGSHDITTAQEAWCDRTTCPCGYKRVFMIGD
jgi:hypothetical protein